MAFTVFRILCGVYIFMAAPTGFGSALQLKVQPRPFSEWKDNELNISCVAETPLYRTSNTIVSIILRNRGIPEPLAMIDARQHLVKLPNTKEDTEVKGRIINGNAGSSFLTLIIPNPKLEDAGTYVCQMFFYDRNFQMNEQKILSNVTYDNVNCRDVLTNLLGKVSNLTKTVQDQTDVNLKQNEKIGILEDFLQEQNKTIHQLGAQGTQQGPKKMKGEINWVVRVVTGNVDKSGTNAEIYIQLTGSSGSSRTIHLDDDYGWRKFETGETDVFGLTTKDIGTPITLRVWHDNTGNNPGWNLVRIELIRVMEGFSMNYVFGCNCWLARTTGDGKIDRTLSLSPIHWMTQVVTSRISKSGTDANVYIQLIGDEGRSREIHLTDRKNNFESGDTDVFQFRTKDVGNPTSLRVRHDNTGSGSGWHLTRIELTRLSTHDSKTYIFNCGCWFARNEGDGKIDRTLPLTSG